MYLEDNANLINQSHHVTKKAYMGIAGLMHHTLSDLGTFQLCCPVSDERGTTMSVTFQFLNAMVMSSYRDGENDKQSR